MKDERGEKKKHVLIHNRREHRQIMSIKCYEAKSLKATIIKC
jgi:hypothetical protein